MAVKLIKSKRGVRHVLVILTVLATMVTGTSTTAMATESTAMATESEYENSGRPPKIEIQQDGPMLEVVVPVRSNRAIDRLEYLLVSQDTDAIVQGETEPPQIKLVLALGETYDFTVRSYHPKRGWSRWTEPVTVTGGVIDAYPFSFQAEAGDGAVHLSWSNVGADRYRYEIWTRRGRVVAATTEAIEVDVTGLDNGRTYWATIRAITGDRKTQRSPAIPVTPNAGKAVSVELRDYVTDPLSGRTRLAIRTAVTGATERIDRVRVAVIPNGLPGRNRRASFDETATATSDVKGAWVTREIGVPALDHELITVVQGQANGRSRAVLASSLQTWLLGNVDAFAPGASEFTRVGTWR